MKKTKLSRVVKEIVNLVKTYEKSHKCLVGNIEVAETIILDELSLDDVHEIAIEIIHNEVVKQFPSKKDRRSTKSE